MSEPPICDTHHFRTLDPLTDGQAFEGYTSHCSVCDLVITGTTVIIRLPGCARHTHHPKGNA
jgi:hypothetical protein